MFLCNSFPPAIGGAEKVCKDIVDELFAAGHDVLVITQPYKDGRKSDYILELKATSSYLKMEGLKEQLDMRTDIDFYILFGYGKYFSDFTAKWCKKHNKPFIFMPCGDFHTNNKKIFKAFYSKLRGKKTFDLATLIVVATEWERTHWIKKYKVNPQKIVVSQYVLEDSFTNFKQTAIVEKNNLSNGNYILYIGRTGPNKKIPLLIKSYLDARVHMPLVIAGLHTESLSSLANRHGIQNEKIKFLGSVTADDKKTLISNASFCVFPSSYESFGMVILECAALGCPVLLSNIPPFRELISDNTLFFENTEESLSDRLKAFASIKDKQCAEINYSEHLDAGLMLPIAYRIKNSIPIVNCKTTCELK